MGHYVKMKKRFHQFELLFHVFGKNHNRSSVNFLGQELMGNVEEVGRMIKTNLSLLRTS
jgi:hypothetical protein